MFMCVIRLWRKLINLFFDRYLSDINIIVTVSLTHQVNKPGKKSFVHRAGQHVCRSLAANICNLAGSNVLSSKMCT
eukprot:jgi/Botrbrau1/9802/Bobra.0322s0010.1